MGKLIAKWLVVLALVLAQVVPAQPAALLGPSRALLSQQPNWCAGMDLCYDYTKGMGSQGLQFPPGTDTHAQTIYGGTQAGVWQSFAANVPVRTNLGLQTVPTRTNSIRNNSMVGASAPSTFPTNWATSGGLTPTVVGTGTENGLPYIDVRFQGTTAATFTDVRFETVTGIPATNGSVWALSASLSLVAGTLNNVTGMALAGNIYDAGGAYSSTVSFAPGLNATISSVAARFGAAATLANVVTAYLRPQFTINHASGVAIDVTIRIAAPQLELGAFASAPILTTGSAVTVNGNQQIISGLTTPLAVGVGGIVQVNLLGAMNDLDRIINFSDGTTTNRLDIYRNGASLVAEMTTGGVVQGSVTIAAFPAPGLYTVAFAFGTNFISGRIVGGTNPTPDTSATFPVLSQMALASLGTATTRNIYGFTRKVAIKFGTQNAFTLDALYAQAVQMAASP